MSDKIFVVVSVIIVFIGISCTDSKKQQGQQLFQAQCANCHKAPKIDQLTKDLWKNKVLPEMGARMGIRDSAYDPYEGYTFEEQYQMIKSGVYNVAPVISQKDWEVLVDYVVSSAPDSLESLPKMDKQVELKQFEPILVNIDSTKGSLITYMAFDTLSDLVVVADLRGNVFRFDGQKNKPEWKFNLGSPITAIGQTDSTSFVSTVGILDPSEIVAGRLHVMDNQGGKQMPFELHRPVHILTEDIDKDGFEEIVISEFGNLTGQLSMFTKTRGGGYERKIILNRPGTIRTVAKDIDGDGKLDLVVMTAQGDEGITIFYQTDSLEFRPEQVIRFSPVFGSSWFELLDYDGDGDEDIITVHGDNGDKTPVLKPYHGLRIHLNDGSNHFSETFFYPFYGATRSVSRDFDGDGDIDIAVVSTFPNYEERPEKSFVYLENKNRTTFDFESFTLPAGVSGRWFLMDVGDVDGDRDEDIILTNFTYSFNALPEDLAKAWNTSDVDMVILENSRFH